MPKYTSRDKVRSGVPLGGIGAGKMEILPNGSINSITFQNNWSMPLHGGAGGILGFHFGIFTEYKGRKDARLLQSTRLDTFPHVAEIDYDGAFPLLIRYYPAESHPRAWYSINSPFSGSVIHQI